MKSILAEYYFFLLQLGLLEIQACSLMASMWLLDRIAWLSIVTLPFGLLRVLHRRISSYSIIQYDQNVSHTCSIAAGFDPGLQTPMTNEAMLPSFPSKDNTGHDHHPCAGPRAKLEYQIPQLVISSSTFREAAYGRGVEARWSQEQFGAQPQRRSRQIGR